MIRASVSIIAVGLVCELALAKLPRQTALEDIIRVLKTREEITFEEASKTAGKDAISALVMIATDASFDRVLRARACLSLGNFQSKVVKKVLTSIFGNESEPLEVRKAALIGYARHARNKAIPDLKVFLLDARPEMRIAAAKGLKEVGGEEARQILIYALGNEEVLEVKLAIDRALKDMR